MKSWINRHQLRIFYVLIFSCMALGVFAAYNANHKSYLVCKRTEATKAYALSTIDRSLKTLPTISYYRQPEHKSELQDQLNNLQETRINFLPKNCDPGIFGLF